MEVHWGRLMDSYRHNTADRESEVHTGLDPNAPPASCDISPELAEKYADIGRAFNFERDSMADDAAELAHLADEEERRAREFHEVEELHTLRESTYVRHCRNRAGEVISEDAFTRSRDGRAQLEDDTIDLALRLEAAGRPALGSGPQPWILDPITGNCKPLVNVRKRAILPTAAAEKRAPIIAALELLLRRKDHKYDVFCTFTGGRRIPLKVATQGAEVREGLRDLHRKLSKLNAQPFMRRARASIIFRSSELGGLFDESGRANKDDCGCWTMHTHAHCLVHFERFLPKKAMRAWTKSVWSFWGCHWSIDGALEKVREACKYVVKPGEVKHLDSAELGALDAALFRLHRVQPLAELREQIRARRESCLTVKRERRIARGDGGERSAELTPVVLPDWNARKANRRRSEADYARESTRRGRNALKNKTVGCTVLQNYGGEAQGVEGVGSPVVQGELLRWDSDARTERPLRPDYGVSNGVNAQNNARTTPRRSPPIAPRSVFQNRVVARLSPAPYFDRVATPGLLVWSDQKPDVAAIRLLPFVSDIIAAVGPQVAEARAKLGSPLYARASACVSVHTNPVTVHDVSSPPPRTPHFPALLSPKSWQKTEVFA